MRVGDLTHTLRHLFKRVMLRKYLPGIQSNLKNETVVIGINLKNWGKSQKMIFKVLSVIIRLTYLVLNNSSNHSR
jgi:hypothetical protein